jgi:hypothetical protein
MVIYALLNNNVFIKENVHEEDRMAAKRSLLIFHAKMNGCRLLIHRWQNERQRSVNDFWPCIMGNQCALWPLKSMYKAFTGCIG